MKIKLNDMKQYNSKKMYVIDNMGEYNGFYIYHHSSYKNCKDAYFIDENEDIFYIVDEFKFGFKFIIDKNIIEVDVDSWFV